MVMEKSSNADTQLPKQFDFLSSSDSAEKIEPEGELQGGERGYQQ